MLRGWIIKDDKDNLLWNTLWDGTRDRCISNFTQPDPAGDIWKDFVIKGYTCVEVVVQELPSGVHSVYISYDGCPL